MGKWGRFQKLLSRSNMATDAHALLISYVGKWDTKKMDFITILLSWWLWGYKFTNKERWSKDAIEILSLNTRKTTTTYGVEPAKSKTQLSYNPNGGSYRWKWRSTKQPLRSLRSSSDWGSSRSRSFTQPLVGGGWPRPSNMWKSYYPWYMLIPPMLPFVILLPL